MDRFNFSGDDDLFGERPPEGAFDSFVFDEPSFYEDELQNIADEPDVCQPPGHEILPTLMQYAQEKAREDTAETALELSFLRDEGDKKLTCKKKTCNVVNFMKHQEALNRAYDDYVKNKKFETAKQRVHEFEDYLTSKGKCHDDTFVSEGGTPKAFREKFMDFVNDAKLDKIINQAPIDFTHKLDDTVSSVLNDPKLQLVVEDSYYPGVIDDAVHKKVDFNKLAFDMSFGDQGPPAELPIEDAPITLLEAFDMRVHIENAQRQQRLKQESERPPEIKKDCEKIGGFLTFLKERNQTHKVNRDEVMLSTTVDVDLNASLRTTPENDLTRAITCLQRAQVMNSYDRSIQIAEQAFVQAPDDLAESAAIIKTNSFIAHVSEQKAMESSGQYKPIEIVSYLGVTEPLPGDPIIPRELDVKVGKVPPKSPMKVPPPAAVPKSPETQSTPPPKQGLAAALRASLAQGKPTLQAISALRATLAGGSCALPSKSSVEKSPKCASPSRSRSNSRPITSTGSMNRSASESNAPSVSNIDKAETIRRNFEARVNIAKPVQRPSIAKPVCRRPM